MVSLHTNRSAIAALQTLRLIDRQMEVTQQRLATGLRINSAADNPAYWSIATGLRSNIKSHGAVLDSLGLSRATADVASLGMTNAIDVVDEIKAKLVLASDPGVDKTKVNKELDALKEQLKSIVGSSSFNGQNWLSGAPDTVSMPSSIKSYQGFTSVGYSTVNKSQTVLINPANDTDGILTKDRAVTTKSGGAETFYLLGSGTAASAKEIKLDQNTTADEISGMLQAIDDMSQDMIDGNALIGVKIKGIERQENFTRALIDASKKALGRLVDADMAEESTRMKALQVQKQLAIQSLSIANSQTELILQLFR